MGRTNEKTEGYNGWTNYETWAVALWIDNDQGMQEEARNMALEVLGEKAEDADKPTDDEKDSATGSLSRILKDWIEEQMPDLGATMWADLLGAAVSEVNWYELAKSRFDE